MPSIHDYIDAIDTWRDTLATELVEKGISAVDTEKLNTLVPKILQIGESTSYDFPEIQVTGQSIDDYIKAIDYWRDNLANILVAKGVEAIDTEKLNSLVPKVLQIESTPPAPTYDSDKIAIVLLDGNDDETDSVEYVTTVANAKSYLDNDIENRYAVHIGDNAGITTLGEKSFKDCNNLVFVTLPNSLVEIKYQSFYGCKSLKSISIPDSVTSIGQSIFYNCTSLATVKLPSNIKDVNVSMFCLCSSLASVTIPDTVAVIQMSAFSNCTSLPSTMILPKDLKRIGGYAFDSCNQLTRVDIQSNIIEIYDRAFYRCNSLTSITINKPENSISGAPWGATNATINWTG